MFSEVLHIQGKWHQMALCIHTGGEHHKCQLVREHRSWFSCNSLQGKSRSSTQQGEMQCPVSMITRHAKKLTAMYYGIYNISLSKKYHNNGINAKEGIRRRMLLGVFYTLHEVVKYYLTVDCGKLQKYSRSLKATTKVRKQRKSMES